MAREFLIDSGIGNSFLNGSLHLAASGNCLDGHCPSLQITIWEPSALVCTA